MSSLLAKASLLLPWIYTALWLLYIIFTTHAVKITYGESLGRRRWFIIVAVALIQLMLIIRAGFI